MNLVACLRASLLGALLAASIPVVAQAKLTLEQAVTVALEKNPVRKAAAFQQRAAYADLKLSRAPLLPHIGFSETYQDGNDPVYVFGSKLRQQRFTTADFDRFDLILAMDLDNLAHLRTIAKGRAQPAIHLLREFEPGAPDGAEVPDPYGGLGTDFDRVLDICERACRGLLDHVRGDADRS